MSSFNPRGDTKSFVSIVERIHFTSDGGRKHTEGALGVEPPPPV
jgi:hypothetical protein